MTRERAAGPWSASRQPTATSEWLAERCYRPVDTDCLVFRGQVDDHGAPVAWTPLDANGKRRKFSVRKDAWEAKNGPVPAGFVVTSSCRNSRCVQHLELITQAEVVRRQWAQKDIHTRRKAATTQASRRRGKLDMEKAREIRDSNETLKEIAGRMGISMTIASLVRRGLAWQEDRNPFSGLLASNDSRKAA